MAHFPLNVFNDKVYFELGEVLWSWKQCGVCTLQQPCASRSCSCKCLRKVKRYFQSYRTLVLDYNDLLLSSRRVFKTHGDIFKAITHLRTNSSITYRELSELLAVQGEQDDLLSAIALVVKVATTVDCFTSYHSLGRLERGDSDTLWKDNVPFNTYITELFTINELSISPEIRILSGSVTSIASNLRATELKKRLKISFRPAHDIRNHLRLDRDRNELHIFHYASFIKEQLKETSRGVGKFKDSLLPRQLLLEVLTSTQQIIFPLSDAKSKRLLRSLVKDSDLAFDPELLDFEFSSLTYTTLTSKDGSKPLGSEDTTQMRTTNEDISYVYLADRLAELLAELRDPSPRTWWDKELQRRSGARYMMMATLIGVLFAVALGALSLLVSVFQAWVSYQAWKHPTLTSQ
ncbi:hypothetical protein HD806DRAFT_211702 [Xylariaceae sp. AK1471]|nr:hypothetical protein HD806DRAFT_211702 [Xylariaceae sp. AK1471]